MLPDPSAATAILNRCDVITVAAATLPVWTKILNDDIPADLYDKVGDLVTILEYIEGWGPSDDDMIANNSCGTAWHDGCR